MTAQEIIARLKEKEITPAKMENIEYWPDEFDEDEDVPEEFKFSDRTIELIDQSNKLYADYVASKDANEKQEKYKAWTENGLLVHSAKMKDKGDYIGVGEFVLVHDIGGGEGGGETVERVWHFKDHNIYLQANGSYYSYHGIDMEDDFFEVHPVEKTITVYER